MNDYKKEVRLYLDTISSLISKIDEKQVSTVINILEKTANTDSIIYIFGNGGSASTASHMQNDFNIGLAKSTSLKFNFCCLSDNISSITAIANDISYDDIYAFQLEKRLKKNDVIIAISGSGNSNNVIKAVQYAKSCGNIVVGITGYDGGKLQKISDYNLHVPINNMKMSEDIHLMFNHMISSILENKYSTNCSGICENRES